ncbi:adenylyl-sulfate kinase [Saccharibacillus endophyticus]|uniref:Adenylyl-sulfate kinase n=1 Tax=Saccharibacillus endophyticus TaxID=2060666 RepID=A0ABQ1ZNI5_9BACL|nr:adenylyl-sulfate kinase [Saccharibacillus endophyticus]GGH72462.1 adenylyl-sulfate kinase [Saccharibacillus endophyticus]
MTNFDATKAGRTFWLTGLPCSGKTTTAIAFAETLAERGVAVEVLDGDELRRRIGGGLGFSQEDRMENVRRAVYLSGLLNKHGVTTIVSLISPYAEMRNYARSELSRFVEVYIECPLEECERRDVKGMYALARQGKITSFTGVSDVYEVPVSPELILRTDQDSVHENVAKLLESFDQDQFTAHLHTESTLSSPK